MTNTAAIVLHYLEQIVKKAKLEGFHEMRVEIESESSIEEAYVKALEKRITYLEDELHDAVQP